MSLLANINASKGKRFKPEDFHPYLQAKKPRATKELAKELYDNFSRDF